MKCLTRDFGEITICEQDIIEFVQPPFGFEDYKKYTLIYDQEIGTNIVWLQSIEQPHVCFILFDPSSLEFYSPQFSQDVLAKLGDGELICWVIGVIPERFQDTTVNLKSPILINTDQNLGAQVILEQEYSVRYPFWKEAEV